MNCNFFFQMRTMKFKQRSGSLETCEEADFEEENDILLSNMSLDRM